MALPTLLLRELVRPHTGGSRSGTLVQHCAPKLRL